MMEALKNMNLLASLESIRTPFLDQLFLLISQLGGEIAFTAVILIALWCVNKRAGFWMFFSWGCGTAAVVSPIGKLVYKGHEYVINGGKTGALTSHIYDELTGIQWGTKPDRFGWTLKI